MNDSIEQINKLKELLDKEAITQDEFKRLKHEILNVNTNNNVTKSQIQTKFKIIKDSNLIKSIIILLSLIFCIWLYANIFFDTSDLMNTSEGKKPFDITAMMVLFKYYGFSRKNVDPTYLKAYFPSYLEDANIDTTKKETKEDSGITENKTKETWQGQELGVDEKIVTLSWDNKKRVGLWNPYVTRFCSEKKIVPENKIWVLLYGTLNVKGRVFNGIYNPELQVKKDRDFQSEILEINSNDKGITFREAKDNKLKLYSGTSIVGFIPAGYQNEDYAFGEIYFLEINAK